jgi:hypothetical protein
VTKAQPDYLSFLLRLWRARTEAGVVWRASLESPHSGKRIGFASLDDLFSFLRQETETAYPERGTGKHEGLEGVLPTDSNESSEVEEE